MLALDTALSTFVPTDRLHAMRRSAMARSVSWDLFGGLLQRAVSQDGVDLVGSFSQIERGEACSTSATPR
jgi:hypothetical protein